MGLLFGNNTRYKRAPARILTRSARSPGADMLSVTFMIHKFRYTPPFRIVGSSKLPVTYARHHEAAGRDDPLAMESLSW